MSEGKETAKSAAIYAFGVIVSRLAGILMLPVYTRYLTPKDYGIIELLTMTTDIIGLLIGVGISESIFRFYFRETSPRQRKAVLFTSFVLLMSFYAIAGSFGVLCAEDFARYILEGRAQDTRAFQLAFLMLVLDPLQTVPLALLRAQQRAKFFVAVNICKLALQVGLNIYTVVFLSMGVFGILISTCITFFLFGSALTCYLLKHTGIIFHTQIAQQLLKYGSPLIIANIGNFILTFSDRYFLKAYADLSAVGIYSLGYKLGFILSSLTVAPILSAWDPKRFEISNTSEFQEINRQVFFYSSLLIIFVALCMAIGSRDLFRIMSAPAFVEAYRIVPIIMLAYIFQAWTNFANFGIYYKGKTKLLALTGSINSLVILGLSFLLIPHWGVYGAALATMLTFLLRLLLIRYFANKLFPIYFPWGQTLLVAGIAAILCTISFCFQREDLCLSLAQNTLLALLFPVCICFSPLLSAKERSYLIAFFRRNIPMLKTLKKS